MFITPPGVLATVRDTSPFPPVMVAASLSDNSPLNYIVNGGALPPGIFLNVSTGMLAGSPAKVAVATTFTVDIMAVSLLYGLNAVRAFSIVILPTPPVFVTAAGLLANTSDIGPNSSGYTALAIVVATMVDASPVTYALLSGALPGGIQLNAALGILSGTPTHVLAVTTFTFTIAALSTLSVAANRSFSITLFPVLDGTAYSRAALKSTDILFFNTQAPTGWYWLRVNGAPTQLYIDNAYEGGGWVLVISHPIGIVLPLLNFGQSTLGTQYQGSTGFTVGQSNPKLYTTLLPLGLWTAITAQNGAGNNFVTLAHSAAIDIGGGVPIHRARWTWTGWNAQFAWQGASNLIVEYGNSVPGLWSYHIANGYNWGTIDSYTGLPCPSYYAYAPWWYGGCWDGSPWGANGAGSYQNAFYWSGSDADYYNYGAFYVK